MGIMNVKILIKKIHLVSFIKASQSVRYMSWHIDVDCLADVYIHKDLMLTGGQGCARTHKSRQMMWFIFLPVTQMLSGHITSAGNISSVAAEVWMSNYGR